MHLSFTTGYFNFDLYISHFIIHRWLIVICYSFMHIPHTRCRFKAGLVWTVYEFSSPSFCGMYKTQKSVDLQNSSGEKTAALTFPVLEYNLRGEVWNVFLFREIWKALLLLKIYNISVSVAAADHRYYYYIVRVLEVVQIYYIINEKTKNKSHFMVFVDRDVHRHMRVRPKKLTSTRI